MLKLRRLLIIAMCCLVSACVYHYTDFANFKVKPEHSLRIATYNINWGHDEWGMDDPRTTIQTIRQIDADILFIQESTPFWEKHLLKNFAKTYPYHVIHHESNEGGIGILSKYPLSKKQIIDAEHGWFPALLVYVSIGKQQLQLLNVHLIPSLNRKSNPGVIAILKNPRRRLEEIEHFYRQINPNIATIIAGDFNETEKGHAVKYVMAHGFNNATDELDRHTNTWFMGYGPLTLSGRIDHLFYSPILKTRQVQVLHEGDSDHFPVVADFERP